MKIHELKTFLYNASQSGYASGKEKDWRKEEDGSTTIVYKEGEWEMNDNYFGGEPFGGRLTVFYAGKPIWIMVYYGYLESETKLETKEVYGFLKAALRTTPKEFPLRGEKRYKEKEFIYENSWKGDVPRFSGKEEIFHNGKKVYTVSYFGGFVDRRSG